jgi:hypothetical protein
MEIKLQSFNEIGSIIKRNFGKNIFSETNTRIPQQIEVCKMIMSQDI